MFSKLHLVLKITSRASFILFFWCWNLESISFVYSYTICIKCWIKILTPVEFSFWNFQPASLIFLPILTNFATIFKFYLIFKINSNKFLPLKAAIVFQNYFTVQIFVLNVSHVHDTLDKFLAFLLGKKITKAYHEINIF